MKNSAKAKENLQLEMSRADRLDERFNRMVDCFGKLQYTFIESVTVVDERTVSTGDVAEWLVYEVEKPKPNHLVIN